MPERPLPAGFTVRVAETADFPRIAAALEPHRAEAWPTHHATPLEEIISRAHAAGDRCFFGEINGTIAYVAWTRFTEASLPGRALHIPLRSGEAYGYALYVLPQFRAQGLATAAGLERLRWLRGLGIRRNYGWLNARNGPILKVQTRLGYRFVARLEQTTWRIRFRVPLLTVVTFNPADPLGEWCTPGRLACRRGVTIFRRGSFRG